MTVITVKARSLSDHALAVLGVCQTYFDFHSQKWSMLVDFRKVDDKTGGFGWQVWSNDSKYVYCSTPYAQVLNRELTLERVGVTDRKLEKVAGFVVPEGLTGNFGPWMAAAPDGSPLLLRDLSINEIYALDVDLP